MKGKYEIYMKNFMFFILFSVLSITIFAIPKDIERYKKGDESIPSTIKKMKAITGSFDRNEVDGFIIQDVGNKKIVVNKKNLVTGENTMTSKDLEVGGNQNNAFGFNSKDDYIYGIQMEIDKGHNLIKIGKNGLSVDFSIGEITGIDKNEYIYVGDFDKYGNMYVAGDYNIYKININSDGTATATDIGNMEFVYADWGYTEINNEERLYFITNDGKLYYYIKNGIGSRDAIFVTSGIETNKGTVVAIFMAGTNMFYNPSGTNKIYRIDLTSDNPKSELFTELDGVTIKGDGARNYLKSIPDLAVGKAIQNGIIGENKERIFTQGDEIRYLLVIKNSGNYFLGQNEESRYTIMDKIDLSKVESTATNVVAKKYKSLTGGTGEVVPSIPTTLSYNSSGEFKLSSETKQLPILDVGERLEIEYTVKIKTYILDDEVDEIKNMVTGTIPNKEIKSDAQATVIVLKPDVLLTKTSDKTGQVVQSGEVIGYTLKLTNGSKVDAKNYVVKDTLLSNPLLTKPEDVLVEGGSLEGDIFESTGGSVTVPAGKTVTITYTVKVPSEYPNETIVNSVNNGEEVVVEYDNPSVSVVKTSDKTGEVVQPGDEIEYTLTLTNTGKTPAINYMVKDTLLTANTGLIKPTSIVVTGGVLTGDIFESEGGTVTVPAQVDAIPGIITIVYTVMVPENYSNKIIVNSVNGGEDITIEVDKPVVRLRHDVFGYEEKFDDSNELINQDKGIVTDFENIENKNSNPPVILPGNKAIHFISLINPSKVDLKGKSDINHQLDGKQLKDDNGNPAFSEHKFQGIVLTNLDTNEKVFYSEKELNEGQAKAKNTREAITLPEANELKITPKTSSFTFEEKIPSRTAISFVFSSTVNSEGTFNKNTRVTSYAFLPFDSEQNTSEGELRKAVITIGRREADLILSKNVEIEEASVGKFVPYTIEIKNMGQDPVENIIISDKIPPGFTYVEGSAVQELKDGYAEKKLQVIGTKEIEIGPISQIKSGETIVIKYLLKVGVGVKPGTYKNIAVVKNENKENISNTDSVDIDIVADPIFEHTTVIGKVFHDRDEDGIQDYADAKKVHISVDIPKEYYIKNTTTVSKDGKNYSFADKYTTITIRNIKGRVSELEPSTNNMVVIRKELIKPIMANVRVQTLGGTDITQQNNGNIITKHIGDKAKGMTSQDIIITQRVVKNKNGQIFLEIFVLNNGIQEEGLPGVRLATPEGIVVETDRFGRYHVPPVAETLGKNYIIKVDPVTLPKGARFTTENPRVRHLGKVMMKFNFGVKLPELKNIKSTKKTLKTITPELFEIPPELLPKQLSDK